MADVQHWRRIVQPARARAVAIEHESSSTQQTPKASPSQRILTPFLDKSPNIETVKGPVAPAESETSLPVESSKSAWHHGEYAPDPQAEELMDSIMCRLMQNPYRSLEISAHSHLLQIFEAYRGLADRNAQLEAQKEEDVLKYNMAVKSHEREREVWHEERQDYKDEVKRLELLLARGERGLAEVTLARQDSQLRKRQAARVRGDSDHVEEERMDDSLETIFEFLERTNREDDKTWSSQRAMFRKKNCPPADTRRLSLHTISERPMAEEHSFSPLNEPTSYTRSASNRTPSMKTAGASIAGEGLTQAKLETLQERLQDFQHSSTDETGSSSSSAGDLLSNEEAYGSTGNWPQAEEDLDELKRVAYVVVCRRNLDPDTVLPRLAELFQISKHDARGNDLPQNTRQTQSVHREAENHMPGYGRDEIIKSANDGRTHKQSTLIKKASGFFHKAISQSNARSLSRSFSFEAGDDTGACQTSLHPGKRGKSQGQVRRSISPLQAGAASRNSRSKDTALSSLRNTSNGSWTLEQKRASRIPTPVLGQSPYAGPRRGRDSSSSSLLTAIKVSEGDNNSTPSRAGLSWNDSPVLSRLSDVQTGPARPENRRAARESDATDEKISVDGGKTLPLHEFAAAAARAANTKPNVSDSYGQESMSSVASARPASVGREKKPSFW